MGSFCRGVTTCLILLTGSLLGPLPAMNALGGARGQLPPPEIAIRATDFALDLPDRFEAGLVAFSYENAGQQIHNVLFIRLNEGKTFQDFKAARGPQDLPALATPSGGTTSVLPGQRRRFVNDFAPGNYVAFSTSSGPDGVSDVVRGMAKPVTVLPGTQPAKASEPAANLTVTISDAAPIPIPATITAGPQTWKIAVAGTTLHELTIVRLAPGKTVQDVIAFLNAGRRGSSPGDPVAGMQLLPPGQSGWLIFDLEPGEYTVNDIPPVEAGQSSAKIAPVGHFTVVGRAVLPSIGEFSAPLLAVLAAVGLLGLGLVLRRAMRRRA